jgi:hypothetical protein
MDLERCPKCGNRWVAGYERCIECGFVPIGAGLKNAPKKKKKKAGKYVEPGSSRGLLTIVFLGLSVFACYRYQPWKDDWEMIRAMVGKGRHHSIVGEWQIVKTLKLNKDKPSVLSQPAIQSGTLNFSKKGSVKMVFQTQGTKTTANGKYVVEGQLLAMNGVQSGSTLLGLPPSMRMKLAWSGPNQMIASVGSEAVYMRRLGDTNPLLRLIKGGIKGGKNAEAPGAMKGVLSGMEEKLKDAENN